MKRLMFTLMLCLGFGTAHAEKIEISPDAFETHLISPAICVMVGEEAKALAEIYEDGKSEPEVIQIASDAIENNIRETDRYVALWMVAEARNYLRESLYSADVNAFLKRNKSYKREDALGALAKINCSKNEGEKYMVPKRIRIPEKIMVQF